jgi:hypothetical protein
MGQDVPDDLLGRLDIDRGTKTFHRLSSLLPIECCLIRRPAPAKGCGRAKNCRKRVVFEGLRVEVSRQLPSDIGLSDLDEHEFGALVEQHRREMQAHCYRLMGSGAGCRGYGAGDLSARLATA